MGSEAGRLTAKRADGRCEYGWGHYESGLRPKATICVRFNNSTETHMHLCGKHNQRPSSAKTVRPVAECPEDRS